ncbi:MAG: class I SAM-dependent methyltransferase [Rickettsiales bacterium TMED289]|nr:MAG: class I SAM-dependent methyltransferase [Rickettsiales bacterium TMED289]|tara:strand:+ start:2622 stop:3800 length:1179 start_codon:yes stop_codon:yes gene_type:complete
MNFKTIPDQIVLNSLKDISYGKIQFVNYDGKVTSLGSNNKEKAVTLKIKKPGLTFEIINKGSIGLAESYMRGDFDTDNLTDLIEIAAKNINKIHKFSGVLDFPIINFFRNFFIKNTKQKSKENIAKHYDLGNEFFSLWLDKSLTYSSAIFEGKKNDLENAQINKYEKLLELVKPKTGDKILEIGCGWGGFGEFIGKNYDVNLDCITISKKQYEFAKNRIFKNGLNEKVNIQMLDYRDVNKTYNSVASIEMIEAVGKNYLPGYFKKIKDSLKQGGIAAIQAITIDDKIYDRYKLKTDFIQKYIFPGGFLPSKKEILKLSDQNGLFFDKCNSYGLDYSNTLRIWRNDFQKKWSIISKQGFDETFRRMWNFYLSYCEAGFKAKNIDLIQFSMNKN